MISVEELLGLRGGRSPGREGAQELVDHGVVAEAVVGHGVRVQERRRAVAQQLAVAVVSVVVQRLQQRCGAVDRTRLRPERLRHLRVHAEERRPLLCMLRPVPAAFQN